MQQQADVGLTLVVRLKEESGLAIPERRFLLLPRLVRIRSASLLPRALLWGLVRGGVACLLPRGLFRGRIEEERRLLGLVRVHEEVGAADRWARVEVGVQNTLAQCVDKAVADDHFAGIVQPVPSLRPLGLVAPLSKFLHHAERRYRQLAEVVGGREVQLLLVAKPREAVHEHQHPVQPVHRRRARTAAQHQVGSALLREECLRCDHEADVHRIRGRGPIFRWCCLATASSSSGSTRLGLVP
mmetsp:Transcript_80315/g.247657  ORF Transcript_80315/g.247657 Transcript_80315/m.247657 type:complete len:242 (-) Transcript_80315:547-1272(-)